MSMNAVICDLDLRQGETTVTFGIGGQPPAPTPASLSEEQRDEVLAWLKNFLVEEEAVASARPTP